MSPPMSYVAPIIRSDILLELAKFLEEQGSDKPLGEAVERAIQYWIDNAGWKQEDLMPETVVRDDARGYTWKSVFLPTGTVLRIKYSGTFHYAQVEGDYPIHNGNRVSPNQFASVVTGTARDAWRDLWVKRPTDPDYRLADELRSKNGRT